MPPSPRKEAVENNLMVIVGQLLEAAKATSEGLKGLSQEVQAQAKAIITTSAAMTSMEDQLDQLNKIIRDTTYDKNLVGRSQEHTDAIAVLQQAAEHMRVSMAEVKAQFTAMGTTKNQFDGAKWAVWWVIGILAWLVTTGIALYGAIGQWK